MSARKLRTFVHVADAEGNSGVFGPDDKVPAWAVKAIRNPGAWDDGDESADAEAEQANANTLKPEPKAEQPKK